MKLAKNKKRQRGYTLLEYVAGASVLLSIVYFGVEAMGTSLRDLFEGIGTWATEHSNFSGDASSSGSSSSDPSNP